MSGRMRLQKFLSRAGVASRRASEDLIRQGRVRVDGETVTVQGVQVDPDAAVVEVDGRRVELPRLRWVMLHKPPGYLCTRDDPQDRPTVYDLLPAELEALFHVGRLDYLSEGLLLLTNDGDLAHELLHPASETPRRYRVELLPPVPDDLPERLRAGVELEDGPAAADEARFVPAADGDSVAVELTLREGRNREVRRIMAEAGCTIRKLRRVAFGPLELGELPPGDWRELARPEVEALREAGRTG